MARGGKPEADNDAELEQRRQSLSGKLDEAKQADVDGGQASRDAVGLGQAMKLSSEFVAGVAAGGFLGWLIDHFAGWSPWGLAVCTLLGFGAGMLNMMRAAGLVRGGFGGR